MKFERRIDFFRFYKIVTFPLVNIEVSDFDEIINFLASMLKICACRIEATVVNIESNNNLITNVLDDKHEILIIFINLSNNNVIFNFNNENRSENIVKNEGVCIDLASNLSYSLDKKNVELLKVSIYNK